MEAVYRAYNIDLRRDCSQAYSTVNSVLSAVHSVLTALIVYLLLASAVAAVEWVHSMLLSIGLLVVKLAAVLAGAGASNSCSADDVRRDRPAALIDSRMCLACTVDRRLDRLLAYSSWIDTVANSTYHVDADHMRSTMADMWDSAFDAVALNNGLVLVKPVALVIGVAVEELLVLTLVAAADSETNVTNLMTMENHKINKMSIKHVPNTLRVCGSWKYKCLEY